MKKFIGIMLIFAISSMLFLTACAESKVINGKEYEPYGLFDMNSVKSDSIKYEISWGNVVWGAVLFETAVAPIVFFGFYLWEPVGLKNQPNIL